VVRGWAEHLDYDRALPLLAAAGDQIVADAVLVRHRGGARSDIAEVRVLVDPEWRGRGLGVTLMRDLAEIAYDAELDQVVFEMVADRQDEMIRAAESLGAVTAGRVTDFAKDIRGHHHDVVYLALPLGKWWEWSQF
jgi:GNAT superfamily N-acetyltransferase